MSGKDRRLRPEPLPRLTPRGPGADPVSFEISRAGERVEGRLPDTDRRQLARLRKGEFEPEREIDLHGLDAKAAERAVRRELAAMIEAGERCLRVIHGRGLHSEGEAILKESLPRWLAAQPHGPRILAFASTGPGATDVLLRRKR